MSFLGMGLMEVLLVVALALIFLGPERMVDGARFLGKALMEVRRLSAQLGPLDLEEDDTYSPREPLAHRGGGPSPSPVGPNAEEAQPPPARYVAPADGETPVAFRSATGAGSQESAERPHRREGP